MFVGFQSVGKKSSQKTYDAFLHIASEGPRDGLIILVYQHYRPGSKMPVQHPGQVLDGIHENTVVGVHIHNGIEDPSISLFDGGRFEKIVVIAVQIAQNLSDPGHKKSKISVGTGCKLLEIEQNDWKSVPILFTLLAIGDGQPVEPCVALVFKIEECVEHGYIRGLTEPARAGV